MDLAPMDQGVPWTLKMMMMIPRGDTLAVSSHKTLRVCICTTLEGLNGASVN
jgi:hypothetical protein